MRRIVTLCKLTAPVTLATMVAFASPAALAGVSQLCDIEQITDAPGDELNTLMRPTISGDGKRVFLSLEGAPLGPNPDTIEWHLWQPDSGLTLLAAQTDLFTGYTAKAFADTFGKRVSVESNQDLDAGNNADGNYEIFLWKNTDGFQQITNTTTGTPLAKRISHNGQRVAFSHDGDVLNTSDLDDGQELYWWANGATQQITDETGEHLGSHCISGDGSVIGFISNANITGENADRNRELFMWSELDGISQWTNTMGGSANYCQLSYDGKRVALASTQDLLNNGNEVQQIFILEDGSAEQITQANDAVGRFFGADMHLNRIAFRSTDDLTGFNDDGSEEVFLWTRGGDQSVKGVAPSRIDQVTDALPGSQVGFWISMNDDGSELAFSSNANFTGENNDGGTDAFIASCPLDNAFPINAGHDGVWNFFNQGASVQSAGALIEVVPAANSGLGDLFVGGFFTHDEDIEKFQGSSNRWFTLQGTWSPDSDTATFQLFQVLDANFGGTDPGMTFEVGEGLVRMHGCSSGEMSFTLFDYTLSGTWQMSRTFINDTDLCTALSMPVQ